MENEKKPSRLGVRLSAVMIAVLLVVCMAVPAFATDINLPDLDTLVIPDDVPFAVVLKNTDGDYRAYYSYEDNGAFVERYCFYESYRKANMIIPADFYEMYPYFVIGRVTNYEPYIYMSNTPFYVDGSYIRTQSGESQFFKAVRIDSSGNWGSWDGGYNTDEVSIGQLTFTNFDVYSPSGDLVRPADSLFSWLFFSADKQKITLSRSIPTDGVWGAFTDYSVNSVRFYGLSDVFFSASNIKDSQGNVFIQGFRTPLSYVGSGLTVVMDWVGSVVSAVVTGPMSGLLILLAVPVAIVLLLVAFIVIRRIIWGA